MACIEVVGGERLHGEMEIQGSKNAVLPILAATVLNKGISKVDHCPRIQDVYYMIKLLEGIGCAVHWEQDSIVINAKEVHSCELQEEYVTKVRASIIILGALVGRMGQGIISYPGGCSIGARPVDIHLLALKRMQVEVVEENEHIHCFTKKVIGCTHCLRFPSVGATENILLASVLAQGTTCIKNAAKEPEIVSLCEFLVGMGAKIYGAGTGTIVINGVDDLHDVTYKLPDDRIVTGTYLTAVAGTGGYVMIRSDCIPQLREVVRVLVRMGNRVKVGRNYICLKAPKRLKGIPILCTEPYPGFPTDMQSQFMTLFTVAKGTSVIDESIFESRYQNAYELRKLGADIKIIDNRAWVKGTKQLHGSSLVAHDLRGGAALIIAALMAQGRSCVTNIGFVERGYEDICKDLKKIGANINRVD